MLKKCILLFIFSGALLAQSGAKKNTLENLDWLAGCWENKSEKFTISEQWMKPAGEAMLGMNRTVANGKMGQYELLQIKRDEKGAIWYLAAPSGHKVTKFKLVNYKNKIATFENLEHDFPQRIIYEQVDKKKILARIEGESKGKKKAIDFPFLRVRCD